MESTIGDEKYNLDEIYPANKLEFDNVTEETTDQYKKDCIKISKKICLENDENFLAPCQKFIRYLIHIKNQSHADIHIQSCKYFSYKLKNELRNIKKTCNNTEDCYNTMINEYSEKTHGIDVCKDQIEEINDNIFEKFKNLDSLYDIFYKFTITQEDGDNGKCHLGETCSKKYNDHIKLCHEVSHIGFCKALDKFKDIYNNHVKSVSNCENVPRYLYSPFGMGGRPIFFISLITIFAMSIIMFTVYKFTPVYSWLQSILRRKSNIRNDLHEESSDLKNNANIKKLNSKNSPLNIQYHSSENS